jgi:hypothetical protein
MISLLLRVLALILFLSGGFNGTLFSQGELDLVCFGLAAWVLAGLVEGYGPAVPGARRE